MEIVFFSCLAAIFYTYFGYPLAVMLLASVKPRRVRKKGFFPFITIVIAAYNEEECISKTIENKLKLDYPNERMEIIVVSDGSTDRTDEIIQAHTESGHVRFIRQEPRAGKTSALNLAASCAKGKIIVFSDANSLYERDALQKLVRNFNDPEVGYVTGKMIYVDPEGTIIGSGCSAYMRYENFLRKQETLIGSIVGVDGGIDAVRKELYSPMKPDQLPDFVLPLTVVEKGYRVVYEAEALLKELTLKSASDEYRMRLRVTLRALWALFDMVHLLTFRTFHAFAWQLWSHKVLRYLCPLFLLGAYSTNLLLFPEGIVYRLFFVLQNAAYVTFVLSTLSHRKLSGILRMLNYFVLLNAAALHAFLQFLMGRKKILWTPRKG